METMHRTADTDALLDCDSLRAALYRCFAAYHDRPLFAIVERRRGRGSAQRSETQQHEGAGRDKKKSKVHFATYMKMHRGCQYIRFSIAEQLLIPKGSKCGILCRSAQHAREIVCWQLACVMGGFVLVMTDWNSRVSVPLEPRPEAQGGGSGGGGSGAGFEEEADGCVEDMMDSARRLVCEGARAVLAEEEAVASLVVAVAEVAVGLTREQASRRRLVRDIVVVS